jgi:hypothetical protein
MPDVSQMTLLSKGQKELMALQKASLKWYWRLLAVIVAISAVVGATFQVLNYLQG